MRADVEVVLFDRGSGNQLGEFATVEEALETYARYVAADPPAAGHLEIWLDDQRLEIDPQALPPVSAA